MAAAVQALTVLKHNDNEVEISCRLSVMTNNQTEQVSWNSGNKAPRRTPRDVRMRVITAPTSGALLNMQCDPSTGSTTAFTIPVKVYTEMGNDITGAVVDIIMSFDGVSVSGAYAWSPGSGPLGGPLTNWT